MPPCTPASGKARIRPKRGKEFFLAIAVYLADEITKRGGKLEQAIVDDIALQMQSRTNQLARSPVNIKQSSEADISVAEVAEFTPAFWAWCAARLLRGHFGSYAPWIA